MLNIIRSEIIRKGFANKHDIRKFIPCGAARSKEIFDEIQKEVTNSGKVNIKNKVLSKRLLKYIGLTESEVFKYCEKEKADATTSTSD